MKISVWIPKGMEGVKEQLRGELKTAACIDDSYRRESVQSALNKLIDRTQNEPYKDGIVICSDGCEVISQPYSGKVKVFRAGKEYYLPEE